MGVAAWRVRMWISLWWISSHLNGISAGRGVLWYGGIYWARRGLTARSEERVGWRAVCWYAPSDAYSSDA